MKLTDIVTIEGKIRLASGLHIGGGDQAIQIGGIDKPVIRHPNNQNPYIPGSSLKGKIRTLLEHKLGVSQYNKGKPSDVKANYENDDNARNNADKIAKLFGNGDPMYGKDTEKAKAIGPSRGVFADAMLSRDFCDVMIENSEYTLSESKMETKIDRLQGTAANKSLRTIERVPEGVVFDFSFSVKILKDGDRELVELLKSGMKLLELDYLGGHGSRGYGKVVFEGLKITESGEVKPLTLPQNPFAK
jgi:CRISPR-associated protein Csm3